MNEMSNTNMKYITYRKDRDVWQVKFRGTSGRTVTRSFKTKEEAIAHRDKYVSAYDLDRKIIVPRKPLQEVPAFKKAFEIFVEHKSTSLKPSTLQHYITTMNFFVDIVGDIPLNEITEWQRIFANLQKTKNVSYDYLTKKIREISQVYDYYMSLGLVEYNPLKDVRLANHDDKNKNQRRAFTDEEKAKFMTVCLEHYPQWHLLFKLYFETGCRRGELLAITFTDVDTVHKALKIKKNVSRGHVQGKYGETITQPKTKGSVREVPLSDENIKRIMRIKEEKNLPDTAFVFSFSENHSRWIAIDAVTQTFIKIRKLADLPNDLTLHSTRHTFASTLLTNGVDYATVAELGGWSSAAVLMAVYAHSNNAKKQEVMRKFMFCE